jgi:hypothetical protein
MTRGDCEGGPRPCPHQTCRYHLEVGLPESCCLDVADRGSQTLEQVGEILGITRERVRQIEERALLGARQRLAILEEPPDARNARRLGHIERALERAYGGNPPPAQRWRSLTVEQAHRHAERQRQRLASETPEQRQKRLEYLRDYCQRRRAEKNRPWQEEPEDCEVEAAE